MVDGGIGYTDGIIGNFLEGFSGDGEFYPGLTFFVGEGSGDLGVDLLDAALVAAVDGIVFFGDAFGALGVGLKKGFQTGVQQLADVIDEGR